MQCDICMSLGSSIEVVAYEEMVEVVVEVIIPYTVTLCGSIKLWSHVTKFMFNMDKRTYISILIDQGR